MTAPRYVRCFYCGNLGTTSQPLVIDDEGRINHLRQACDAARDANGNLVWLDDETPKCRHPECAYVDGDRPCPPLLDGWDTCWECSQARPENALVSTFMRITYTDGTIEEGEETVDGRRFYVCKGECAEPVPHGIDLGGEVWTVRHPILSHRHRQKTVTVRAIDRDDDTRRDQEETDEDRLDLIARDGDGMTLPVIADAWDVSERTARRIVLRLVDEGRLGFEERPTRAGGAPRKVYWRVEE
jgi:hypothetical protein